MKKLRIFTLFLLVTLLLPQGSLAADEDEMQIAAKAVVLYDADYDEVLYSQNAQERIYPASTTKIMTGILVVEAIELGGISLDSVITASEEAIAAIPITSSHQSIKPGEQMTVEQLLYCLLVPSANDAAAVLAESIGGTIESFVNLMNVKAQALGLSGTHYVNPHGLHDDEHYTTALDLAVLADYAMTKELFAEVVGTAYYVVPETNLSAERKLYTTNYMLSHMIIPGYTYDYATGIKTGTTDEAGYCLVSSATKNDRNLIAVVMGTELERDSAGLVINRPYLSESKRLLEWGFSNFTRREIINSTDIIGQVEVTLSNQADYVVAHPEGSLEATLPKNLDLSEFDRQVLWQAESIQAPVVKGQVLGSITLSYNGVNYGSLNLVALNDVEASPWLVFWNSTGPLVMGIAAAALVLLVVLFIAFLVHRSRRRRGRRRRRY